MSDDETRRKNREKMARWLSVPANRAKANARSRAWRAANRDRMRDQLRAWQKANPERCRQHTARRQALKLGQFVEEVHALVVLERDDGVCGICGLDVDPQRFHVDHTFPLSLGGLHCYDNVQAAHPSCNSAKGARVLDLC